MKGRGDVEKMSKEWKKCGHGEMRQTVVRGCRMGNRLEEEERWRLRDEVCNVTGSRLGKRVKGQGRAFVNGRSVDGRELRVMGLGRVDGRKT